MWEEARLDRGFVGAAAFRYLTYSVQVYCAIAGSLCRHDRAHRFHTLGTRYGSSRITLANAFTHKKQDQSFFACRNCCTGTVLYVPMILLSAAGLIARLLISKSFRFMSRRSGQALAHSFCDNGIKYQVSSAAALVDCKAVVARTESIAFRR